jgi:hypothetical protein
MTNATKPRASRATKAQAQAPVTIDATQVAEPVTIQKEAATLSTVGNDVTVVNGRVQAIRAQGAGVSWYGKESIAEGVHFTEKELRDLCGFDDIVRGAVLAMRDPSQVAALLALAQENQIDVIAAPEYESRARHDAPILLGIDRRTDGIINNSDLLELHRFIVENYGDSIVSDFATQLYRGAVPTLGYRVTDCELIGEGDAIAPYLTFVNNYSGYLKTGPSIFKGMLALSTCHSIVCSNTLAHGVDCGEHLLKLRHKDFKGFGDALNAYVEREIAFNRSLANEARVMASIRLTFDEADRFFSALAMPMAEDQKSGIQTIEAMGLDAWGARFAPCDVDSSRKLSRDEGKETRWTKQAANLRNMLWQRAYDGDGATLESRRFEADQSGTLWGAVNAATYYATHDATVKTRSYTDESGQTRLERDEKTARFESSQFGQASRLGAAAMTLARSYVASRAKPLMIAAE